MLCRNGQNNTFTPNLAQFDGGTVDGRTQQPDIERAGFKFGQLLIAHRLAQRHQDFRIAAAELPKQVRQYIILDRCDETDREPTDFAATRALNHNAGVVNQVKNFPCLG